MKTSIGYSNVLAIALLVTTTACSNATGPEGTPPPPGPRFTTVYDLELETRYIRVQGSCDEDILGNSTPGEFQYKIVVNGVGVSYIQSSSGYNTVTGEDFQRNAGTDIDFANRTYTFDGLPSKGGVEVELHGAEWDGVVKDSRMANRGGAETVPFVLGRSTNRVIIGATADCQIRLFYDASWSQREVPND